MSIQKSKQRDGKVEIGGKLRMKEIERLSDDKFIKMEYVNNFRMYRLSPFEEYQKS